ncbi:DUF2255 family protein [Actinomycetospora sp. OC33-EN08]|uniref:DUF2255 family protein n=1 Tax=Actinomycetospora aurantiaca TaxID=3129233 RepID=A0ABU8MU77_9PSEU
MSSWSSEELEEINAEVYLHLAAALPDGSTPKWVDIWSVPVGDRLFVRSFNGVGGGWFGPALESGRGRITAGRVARDVTFVVVPVEDEQTNAAVDVSFRAKYADSPYAETMSTDPVRLNTLEVVPR